MARQIHLHITPELCRTCHVCLAAGSCKVRAIVRIDADEPPFIDVSRCYNCRLCIAACPFGAISVESRSDTAMVTL